MCTNQSDFISQEEQEEIEKQQKYRKKQIKKIQDILDYGTTKYGCQFPKGFAEKLYDMIYNNWIPNRRIIDSLMVQWKIWEPFVDKDSFHKFMKYELERMTKNHTTSTFGLPILNQYIGKKAKVIKEIPVEMSTTVHMSGLVKLNGREVEVATMF